jgi:outer membrane protein assembly factor BamE (lipoprotein component of BamABCDE complex)
MKNFRTLAVTGLTALMISGCTPTHDVRGNIIEDYRLAEVKEGVDSRSEVLRKYS